MNLSISKLSLATLISLVASTYPHTPAHSQSTQQPFVYSTSQFPQTKTLDVRHTIRLFIPDNSEKLTKISIAAPKGATIKNDVRVKDKDGRILATSSQVDNGILTITFASPLVGGNKLQIDLNQVRLWGLDRSYRLTAINEGQPSSQQEKDKRVDLDIHKNTHPHDLGSAQFRRY